MTFTLATVTQQPLLSNHNIAMLKGICYYDYTNYRVGHVFSIEPLHSILANQISDTDF